MALTKDAALERSNKRVLASKGACCIHTKKDVEKAGRCLCLRTFYCDASPYLRNPSDL